MNKWMTVADELSAVRKAREEFLVRAFVDRSIIGPLLLDRIAADIGVAGEQGMGPSMRPMQSVRRVADE